MRHCSSGNLVHTWHKDLLPVSQFMLTKVTGSYAVILMQN